MARPAEARRGWALPLSLYVHLPWCPRKCPYCDFNSHPLPAGAAPFDSYVTALLEELDHDLRQPAARRPLTSIFLGGGTPSLFPGEAIRALLDGIRARMDLAPDCEITLEANPGASDGGRFAAYRAAGVNRLSIGIQSLSAPGLRRLGRAHDPAQARAAVATARAAGFDNLNLDLMHGLPGQSLVAAMEDLAAALALDPEHLSWYQLTPEAGTPLGDRPPPDLPDADILADMAERGQALLADAGFIHYEVSAHARPGRCCRHNLNYWRFGDYLGIGAGAHGKLTDPDPGLRCIRRIARCPDPVAWLNARPAARIAEIRQLAASDVALEFALNALRLTAGFERRLFTAATGLSWERVAPTIDAAIADGLLMAEGARIRPTPLGQRFLDDLVARFVSDDAAARRVA